MRSRWLVPLALLALGLQFQAVSPARAGNDDSILFGGEASMLGGAVTATTADGNALMYNPGGLALTRSLNTFDAHATASMVRLYNVEGLLSAADGTSVDASVFEFVPVPSAVTYVRQLSDDTTAALGLFTTEASDYTLRTRFETDGFVSSEWQIAAAYESQRFSVGAGFGWEISRGLYLGVAVFGTRLTLLESLQVGGGARSPGGMALGVSSLLREDSLLGLQARVGLMARAADRIQVGVSLASPAAHLTGTSRSTSIDAAAAVADGAAPEANLDQGDGETDLGSGLYAPLRARVGVAFDLLPALMLSLDGDVQTPLEDAALALDRKLQWNVRVGARYDVSDTITLGLGLFTDRAAERGDTLDEPPHFYGATVGARYVLVHPLAEPNANPVSLSTTASLRYAYGSGSVPGTQIDTDTFDVRDTRAPLTVHELALYLGSTVSF